jgi:hypothetical protein
VERFLGLPLAGDRAGEGSVEREVGAERAMAGEKTEKKTRDDREATRQIERERQREGGC